MEDPTNTWQWLFLTAEAAPPQGQAWPFRDKMENAFVKSRGGGVSWRMCVVASWGGAVSKSFKVVIPLLMERQWGVFVVGPGIGLWRKWC